MTRSGFSQFYQMAEYYDALNHRKDYRAEAKQLERIVQRLGVRGPSDWLDVACGTGRHLEQLRRGHRVVGLDKSPEMLRIARRRLRGVRLVVADMRRFRLADRFDVVSCLFSAIGHLPTKESVRITFTNFARHLRPGGVVIVEPWIERDQFRPGFIDLRTFESPSLAVARCSVSERRRNRSIVHYHFLIGKRGHDIEHYAVTDAGLLLSRTELLGLLREAGFRVRFLAHGLTRGRGLYVGVKT